MDTGKAPDMEDERITLEVAFTFDDVLLLPQYSEILPSDVVLKTRLTRGISLNIPVVSAAMDTVTEYQMAIAIAREGGIGIIHRNLSIEEQALHIKKVKRAESWIITDPVTVSPNEPIKNVIDLMEEHGIGGIPVVENGRLVGIVTRRDLRFEVPSSRPVSTIMTSNVITARKGISMEEAERILRAHKIEKLPILDEEGRLAGLITYRDIIKTREKPNAVKDSLGRLLVGGAIGTGKHAIERAEMLLPAGCDVLVIDTAHGHTRRVIETLREIKEKFKDVQVIAGNIATAEGAKALIEAGADAIKVGVGPGSICTTRIVAGVGVPQLYAIMQASFVARQYDIPVIADGGIRYSGDIVKALAAGADCVMIGSLLAGTEEAPGETIIYEGRKFKTYRGMGSLEAMAQGSADRYAQEYNSKFVPEGVSGRVPYRGRVEEVIYQLMGGVRSGMAYTGASTIKELQQKARFIRITPHALRESHVHDVIITHEAPNYISPHGKG